MYVGGLLSRFFMHNGSETSAAPSEHKYTRSVKSQMKVACIACVVVIALSIRRN